MTSKSELRDVIRDLANVQRDLLSSKSSKWPELLNQGDRLAERFLPFGQLVDPDEPKTVTWFLASMDYNLETSLRMQKLFAGYLDARREVRSLNKAGKSDEADELSQTAEDYLYAGEFLLDEARDSHTALRELWAKRGEPTD